MADVLFLFGLSLTLVLIVIVNMHLKRMTREALEDEEKEQQKKRDAARATLMGGGSTGKALHLSPEEMKKNSERLYELFGHGIVPTQKTAAGPQKPPAEVPKRPTGPRPAARKPVPSVDPEQVPKREGEQILSETEQVVEEA